MNYNHDDITNENYNEFYTLKMLDNNIEEAAKSVNALNETDPDGFFFGQITIIVNGVAHALLLGGPQMAGLNLMIKHILSENTDVDKIIQKMHTCHENCADFSRCQLHVTLDKAIENYLKCDKKND